MLNFTGELVFGHRVLNFNVSANINTLTLTGTTVKKGFLYAYLYDSEQQLRANLLFQKTDKTLILTSESASLGGIAGNLPAGDWQLHLYNLEGENRTPKAMHYAIDIKIDVELNEPFPPECSSNDQLLAIPTKTCLLANTGSPLDHNIHFDYQHSKNNNAAWYRGDLHAHTLLSDGHNTLAAAAQIAEQQALDFFFITEHNICHPALPATDKTLILPAIEVTTDQGHFNVHGPRRMLNMFNAAYSSAALIEQGLGLVGRDEGNISINHPMMKPWHWHYQDIALNKVNTLEVCCDPTWPTSPKATEGALTLLTQLWNCGHRIAAVGGSDSHLAPHERNANATEPSIYGDPSTFVYADTLSGNGILQGLRQGHIYLERQCGLDFQINNGTVLPGQDVGNKVIDYHLAITDKRTAYYAECIADGEVINRIKLTSEARHFQVDMSNYAWLRIDIRRATLSENSDSCVAAFEGLINPIYNATKTIFSHPQVNTWGELMEEKNTHGN
ncbi:CehA/McbA family metallohydrolase [Moritella sp. F3]|uniref:CehA/McbA family metallohydrolase n=1 Tax=Moritella sp. F3 TaxID=2718882 RepID=UPI0018E150FD|nr:CehA/McbA family metallohydrolase [Moritella sp. F3]GIC76270.1 phosphoesterase [Moritella sp. F1]GIC82942.1 phosphoesterase [Moritella sp. F3]